MTYLWIKALHMISVICWMAGLLYLPRLFVYQSMITEDIKNSSNNIPGNKAFAYDMLLTMERKLLYYIMTPSMILSIVFGFFIILINPSLMMFWWMHLKLTAAFAMVAFNIVLYKHYNNFLHKKNKKTSKFFRAINEIPTILMILIVIMVIVQP